MIILDSVIIADDQVLTEAGIKDLDQYAVEPGQELMPDFFLDGSEGMGEIRKLSEKAFGEKREGKGAPRGDKASTTPSGGQQSPAAIFEAIGQKLKKNPDPKLRGIYAFEIGGTRWSDSATRRLKLGALFGSRHP